MESLVSDYPVLIEDKTKKIFGEIIDSLTEKDFKLLSFSEGDEYVLSKIEIETDKINRKVRVLPYKPEHLILGKA